MSPSSTPEKPEEGQATGSEPQEISPLAALEQEVLTLKDQLLRRRAEFDNYRRRVEREQNAAGEDAVVSLLSDLLPSLDSLDKALQAKGTLEEIRAGVEITLKDISSTLANRGVTAIDPTGEKFDPLKHQALSYEPAIGFEDGSVVTCYRKGYVLGDRLIRPALVKVAQHATVVVPPVDEPVSH